MIFHAFLLNENESNAYVLGCETTHQAILIDAGAPDSRIIDFIEEHNLILGTILITHDHYDHTGGLPAFAEHFSPKLLSGKNTVGGMKCHAIKQDDRITIGTLEGQVLFTPGHTPDSISILFPGMVFTGDALFSGSIGGTHSEGQKALEIQELRKQVLSLSEDTEIYPGHGPASTVAIEREYNPFFVYPM